MQKKTLNSIGDNKSRGKTGRILSIVVVVISLILCLVIYSLTYQDYTIAYHYITFAILILFIFATVSYVIGEFFENRKISILGCIVSCVLFIVSFFFSYNLDFLYIGDNYMTSSYSTFDTMSIWLYLWLIAVFLEIISIYWGERKQPKKVLYIIAISLSSLTFLGLIGYNIESFHFSYKNNPSFIDSYYHAIMFAGSVLFFLSVVLYFIGEFTIKNHVVSIFGCIGSWVFFVAIFMFMAFAEINSGGIQAEDISISVWPIAGILEIISLFLSQKRPRIDIATPKSEQ